MLRASHLNYNIYFLARAGLGNNILSLIQYRFCANISQMLSIHTRTFLLHTENTVPQESSLLLVLTILLPLFYRNF